MEHGSIVIFGSSVSDGYIMLCSCVMADSFESVLSDCDCFRRHAFKPCCAQHQALGYVRCITMHVVRIVMICFII